MAIPHATSGEIVSLRPLGDAAAQARPYALVKTTEFEAMRLFLSAGKELKEHKVDGSITLQCLEGRVEFRFDGETRVMMPGDWLYLVGGVSHSLFAQENASLLLTIMLRSGSAIASD